MEQTAIYLTGINFLNSETTENDCEELIEIISQYDLIENIPMEHELLKLRIIDK